LPGLNGESLGICHVSIAEAPFLTLPRACEGAQATYYGAFSWEGEEDFGSVITRDEADNPLGFHGCGALVFSPAAIARPTTEEADSPSGFDLSIQLNDEGLKNPAGVAGSQIRDLELSFPQGMSVGPALSSPVGSCSEADLETETPESMPGGGCPTSSEIGTAEVESPLADEPIDGVAYRATPGQNLAGDAPAAFYLVLKSPDLGIVITQPVGLEGDPESGAPIAFAEEMPQLSFSHLRLHLDDGEGGPLVSPPLCGEYETETGFDPWAGGGTLRALSAFQISSGPSGGPCPSGTHEGHSESGPPSGVAPPAAIGPAAPHRPVLRKPRCRKGKHRVRRHGKARCVTERHRKHKARAR
jgi:hypothetical protein